MSAHMLSFPNSVSYRYKNMSKREKLLEMLQKNLKKIGRQKWIDNPVQQIIDWYNAQTKSNFSSLDDLDDVTLEWMNNMIMQDIFALCTKIKTNIQDIIYN